MNIVVTPPDQTQMVDVQCLQTSKTVKYQV